MILCLVNVFVFDDWRVFQKYINPLIVRAVCNYVFECIFVCCCVIIIHFLVYFSSWRQIFIFGLCYIYSIYSNIWYQGGVVVFGGSNSVSTFHLYIRFEIWYSELMMMIYRLSIIIVCIYALLWTNLGGKIHHENAIIIIIITTTFKYKIFTSTLKKYRVAKIKHFIYIYIDNIRHGIFCIIIIFWILCFTAVCMTVGPRRTQLQLIQMCQPLGLTCWDI